MKSITSGESIMKDITEKISLHPKYSRFYSWCKLITITGGTQVFVQGVGFLCGILIVRLLPTQEYALYTLANTMLGSMTMLADSGISNGVMAQGGKVWQEKEKLGIVLITGMQLRKYFGIISLLVTLPVLSYLLLSHGASWITSILIVASIVPAFFAALSDSFLEMPSKLHQSIAPLQRNQAEVSVGRLMLSTLFLFAFPFTFMALFANSLPRIYGNYQLRKIASKFASKDATPDPLVKKEITKGVKKTLPIVIYHCVSGQISLWLLSFFGTTASISELGALGRLSIVFTMFTTLFATLVVPRFARMPDNKRLLLKTFLFVQFSTLFIGIIILIAIYFFSGQFLWLLGTRYTGLNFELLLVGTSGCIGLISGVTSQLLVSRAWFPSPYLLIGVNFVSTVVSIGFLNISSLKGILTFNIVVTSITYLILFSFSLLKIGKLNRS